jgi:two-component system CheB/CheR fusion protein
MSQNEEKNPAFEALLDYLKQSRSFDFTVYKRSSLMRRVRARMQVVAIDGFEDYLDYLEVHPDEFVSLFNTILINVTNFFRDSPVSFCPQRPRFSLFGQGGDAADPF